MTAGRRLGGTQLLISVLEAAQILAWMAVAEVLVRLLPLPAAARWMGVPLGTGDATSGDVPGPRLRGRDRRRLRLLEVVGPHWRLCGGPCLRQALVAGHILRHHAPVLRIGAAIDGSALVAHAWVEVGSFTVGRAEGFASLVRSPAPAGPGR